MNLRRPVLALVFLAAAAMCHAADLYRVAGVVINTQTGAPIPHAHVYIFKSGGAQPRSPFITGIDGRFSFDLPEGSYALRAGPRTWQENYGERNQESALGSAVIVGPGKDTGNVIFRCYPLAAISGRVVDDAGEPVEGALVQLLRSHVSLGIRAIATWRWDRTNDRGEFRFGDLPGGGRYYLMVTGKPWYETNLPVAPGDEAVRHPTAFIPVYYPNTPDASRAAPLTPGPGEEARADFTLATAVGATVSVKISGPSDLTGTLSLESEGIPGIKSFQAQQQLTAWPRQTPRPPVALVGVPPGHYAVQIMGASEKSDFTGRTPIDVNGSDVTVDVPVRPVVPIGGHVSFQNPAMKPGGSLRVSLSIDGAGVVANALVRPDGSFAFPNVRYGQFRIGVNGAAGIVLARTQVSGATFRDGLMTVADGEAPNLALTLSDETGTLNGFVMNGDQPLPAVLTVLAPAGDTPDQRPYRAFQTESDGSFDYRNVQAGKYYFFAVDNTALEYANPEAVRPYLADAKVVTITAHGSSTERIAITAPKGQ